MRTARASRPRRVLARSAQVAWLILRGATWRVALPVALVVGTVLALVNQGADLSRGNADAGTGVRIVANFLIPYLVSSVGYLSGSRRDDRAGRGLVVPPSRIRILQVPDCPLVDRLIAMVDEALLSTGVRAAVEVEVGPYPSPTLVIDGIDIATGRPVAGAPRCRLDLPTREQLLAAIERLRP